MGWRGGPVKGLHVLGLKGFGLQVLWFKGLGLQALGLKGKGFRVYKV